MTSLLMFLFQYLCSGAGGISGFFIHEKHFEAIEAMPRLEGWWSHKMSTRFQMTNGESQNAATTGGMVESQDEHPLPDDERRVTE